MNDKNKPKAVVRLARQPCSEEDKRRRPLRVFLNKGEEEKLDADAKARRLNRHDYVRQLIMDQVTTTVVRGHQADPRLLEELNRIGNNLNQAVLYVHAGTKRQTDWEGLRNQLEDVLLTVLFGPEIESNDNEEVRVC